MYLVLHLRSFIEPWVFQFMSPLDTRGNSWVEMTGPLTTLPVWGKPGLLDPESPRAMRPPGQASQRTPPQRASGSSVH